VKSVRLLPIVIFAALALLAFKGIGLVTNGGYVLLGTETAMAAGGGGGGSSEGKSGEEASPIAVPTEPTMTDSSPTLDDSAPTLPVKEASAGEGSTLEGEHTAGGDNNAVAAADGCMVEPGKTEGVTPDGRPCVAAPGADGAPLFKDGAGDTISIGSGGSENESAVLERLGERRTQLDTREQELDMRMALVEAAEKRIAERTAVLEALEARINSLVDQNKASEEEQFKSVVAMYETMKPKDAASILNELDMATLLRVAKGMNPRKMAPIMAKMDPTKAKDLTANMAVDQVEPTVQITGEDLAALPQIVGK
jgi:flagellar motility protein MotE (MotC chaperone)